MKTGTEDANSAKERELGADYQPRMDTKEHGWGKKIEQEGTEEAERDANERELGTDIKARMDTRPP